MGEGYRAAFGLHAQKRKAKGLEVGKGVVRRGFVRR